jgi:hypothetical protein
MAESNLAKQLFEGLKAAKEGIEAIAPGLKDFGPDVKAELSRLGTQGAMELASALFNGSTFVPYGPGQYTPSPEHAMSPEHTPEIAQEHQQEMGRER